LLAYPVAARFGVTKSPAVVITIAGTIVAVLGSLMVLAGVLGVVREGSTAAVWRTLGFLVLYCLAGVYIYPRVTRWFFKKYNDGISQFIYVMVMVFGAAAVASWIGLEAVFGAFFGGLLLNRFIPARSTLMGRLEFVGNAIFIPYFLIGVGMLIDVHVVFDGWHTLYIAAVMSATAMLTKWAAAFATQKICGLTSTDRSMIYQLSNAHTAVALAVVMIGFQMGLFGVEILNGTVVMILVTCTVSSMGTAGAAARMKVQMLQQEEAHLMAAEKSPVQHPRTLVAIDNPLRAPGLVELALSLRMPDSSTPGDLYALHVRNDNSASSRAISRNSLDVAERAAASVEVQLEPVERYDLNFITGVLNAMEERDITEVVIGMHRRTATFLDSFLGEKMERLLQSTNKMIMMARCYNPLSTMARMIIAVPRKAQFETGFCRWVQAMGCLCRHIGCRMEVWCEDSTRPLFLSVLSHYNIGIHVTFRRVGSFDDFVVASTDITADDLAVIVGARRASVSFSSDMESVPEYVGKYLAHTNLIMLYPGQFGTETPMTMADILATDVKSTPSPIYLWLQGI
ncbi:MAG: cation:proton antiporter, partial [Duncaniella sp.]|nr:cation:proton antiporter [Duncaniella sp.]